MKSAQLKTLLDKKVAEFNGVDFIKDDPVSIPHQFSKKQDIEIIGFFAAMLAWGQRITIINNCNSLVERFQGEPHQFMLHHSDQDLKGLLGFKHRTFNDTDLLYFVQFFNWYYQQHDSLETAFIPNEAGIEFTAKHGLTNFHRLFFSLEDAPQRTRKHVATPERKSACKRLNMYLRWMVRKDNNGVDFGIWQQIKPHQLMCPLDVHVERVARKLGLLTVKNPNWDAVEELTHNLRKLDPDDPVKYDYALFGMSIIDKF